MERSQSSHARSPPHTRSDSYAGHDSLFLYQESIRHLTRNIQAKDPSTLVTACILAVFELMVGRSRDWRRHLEGCAALFAFFGVHGFTRGEGSTLSSLWQAVFWCYARMELCSAILSEGVETTILPLEKWVPRDSNDELVRGLYQSGQPGVYAHWPVYLCSKVCDLRFCLNRCLEDNDTDVNGQSLTERWARLWRELTMWYDERPAALRPVIDTESTDTEEGGAFPTVFFAHFAAISSNQLYHTACILMLEMQSSLSSAPVDSSFPSRSAPPSLLSLSTSSTSPSMSIATVPSSSTSASTSDLRSSVSASVVWHARRVVGISCSNAHNGSWVNAIQPLHVAGTFFTHLAERVRIARLFRTIDRVTGWGALWRMQDLEAEWGFDEGELLGVVGEGTEVLV